MRRSLWTIGLSTLAVTAIVATASHGFAARAAQSGQDRLVVFEIFGREN